MILPYKLKVKNNTIKTYLKAPKLACHPYVVDGNKKIYRTKWQSKVEVTSLFLRGLTERAIDSLSEKFYVVCPNPYDSTVIIPNGAEFLFDIVDMLSHTGEDHVVLSHYPSYHKIGVVGELKEATEYFPSKEEVDAMEYMLQVINDINNQLLSAGIELGSYPHGQGCYMKHKNMGITLEFDMSNLKLPLKDVG